MGLSKSHVRLLWGLLVVIAVLILALVALQSRQLTEPFNINPRKHVRHVYINPNNVNTMGMGDFIRGSVEMAKICKQLDVTFDVDYSQHQIGKWLVNKRAVKDVATPGVDKIVEAQIMKMDSGTIKNIIVDELTKVPDGGSVFIGTCHPMITYPIEEDIRQFARESFELGDNLKKEVDRMLETLHVKRPYAVIHARLGDHILNDGAKEDSTKYEEFRKKITEQRKKISNDIPVLVISDDAAFKEYLHTSDGYTLIPTKPLHTSKLIDMKDTMIDFALLCGASNIVQYSNYGWGSGFSDRAAELYNIPVYKTGK
jgi:uncharacterized protein (DUF2164 family)